MDLGDIMTFRNLHCTYKTFIHVYICTGVLEHKFSNISSNDFRPFVFLVLKEKKDRILNERTIKVYIKGGRGKASVSKTVRIRKSV